MKGISPEAVYNFLKGTNYPASKNELIMQAKKNNADSDVLNAMETLPDKEYESQDDVILTGSKIAHER
ncbi:MAG: DUF2795 domain-containing protein [Methanobacterium sp.]